MEKRNQQAEERSIKQSLKKFYVIINITIHAVTVARVDSGLTLETV